MVNTIVSSDTFKFLDIRPEMRRPAAERRYTIARSDLKFPPTDFEKGLGALKLEGGSYSTGINKAASKQLAPPLGSDR